MLYSYEELNCKDIDHITAYKRYLYKYINQKKEFRRLKFHEKDYTFGWMEATYTDNKANAFNLYKIKEAKEYLFYKIILTYGENVCDFSAITYGPNGKITANQLRKDKRLFNEYLQVWKNYIAKPNGAYLTIIAPMIRRKIKELKSICTSQTDFLNREKYCYAIFFYIYYKAKLYFDEKKEKYLTFRILNKPFIINIYSFCHILSRHYIPSLNRGLPNTMNDKLPFIDINNFSKSLQVIIETYFKINPTLDINTEYLLFNINNTPYILWIKYKRLKDCYGYEVCSFYKCQDQKDLEKFKKGIVIKL